MLAQGLPTSSSVTLTLGSRRLGITQVLRQMRPMRITFNLRVGETMMMIITPLYPQTNQDNTRVLLNTTGIQSGLKMAPFDNLGGLGMLYTDILISFLVVNMGGPGSQM